MVNWDEDPEIVVIDDTPKVREPTPKKDSDKKLKDLEIRLREQSAWIKEQEGNLKLQIATLEQALDNADSTIVRLSREKDELLLQETSANPLLKQILLSDFQAVKRLLRRQGNRPSQDDIVGAFEEKLNLL